MPLLLLVQLTHLPLLFVQLLTTSRLLFLSILEPVVNHRRVVRSGLSIILIPTCFQLWISPTIPFCVPVPRPLSIPGENNNYIYGHYNDLLLSGYLSCQLSSSALSHQLCLNKVDRVAVNSDCTLESPGGVLKKCQCLGSTPRDYDVIGLEHSLQGLLDSPLVILMCQGWEPLCYCAHRSWWTCSFLFELFASPHFKQMISSSPTSLSFLFYL